MKVRARRLISIVIGVSLGLLPIAPIHAATSADSGKRAVEQASALFKAGDSDAAIAALQKATESGVASAEAYHLLGQIYLKGKKKPHEAAEAFAQALKLKPAYPDALNDLAEVYLAQGKIAEAEQALKRAIEVDPKHEDSYVDLARLYESRREVSAAMNTYKRLLAVRPMSADGLFGLAMLHE